MFSVASVLKSFLPIKKERNFNTEGTEATERRKEEEIPRNL